MTDEMIQKGLKLAKYFVEQYGEKNAKFICSKFDQNSLVRFSYEDLISIGEKIALFNGWATLEDLEKKGI